MSNPMSSDNQNPVARELSRRDIPHTVYRHPGRVNSLEQAAKERGQKTEQVVRSIVFRISDGDYVMVLIAGSSQISWSLLRRYLGVSRITMATPEEVLAVTGFETGAVSPFGMATQMRILVDRGLLDQDVVSIGSGERGVAIFIKPDDILRGLGDAETGNFR